MLALVAAAGLSTPAFGQPDPLPSWNDGPAKRTIIQFVDRVTREGEPQRVPVADRIAVFDNDGTLWCEQPAYVQAFFVMDRVRVMAPQHPQWHQTQPFKSVLQGDRQELATPNPTGGIFKTFTSVLPDVSVSGANRPTITLVPADNSETVRRFLTPIAPETLAFLSETSWPIEVVLRLWVERLNGVPNAVTASGPSRGVISDYQRFRHLAQLF